MASADVAMKQTHVEKKKKVIYKVLNVINATIAIWAPYIVRYWLLIYYTTAAEDEKWT